MLEKLALDFVWDPPAGDPGHMDRLDEAQAEIKIARRIINNLRYADDTTIMAESEEELEPTDEGEREE